jgi:hypothetical protein
MALPAVYSFPGPAGPLPSPPWTQANTDTLNDDGGGHADTSSGATDDCIAYWTADTMPDDQQVQVDSEGALPGDGSQYIELYLRSDLNPRTSGTLYGFYTDGGSDTAISKWISGTQTVLSTDNAITVGAGDTILFTVNGAALEVFINGVSVLTATDGSIASGQTGMGLYSGFGPGFVLAQNFQTDVFGGGGGSAVHSVSGRGNFAVTSPAWLSTVLTGPYPPYVSSGQAEPANLYHAGMLSWGTSAHGAMKAYPVTRELDLVELPAGMDTVWFEFAPGVAAVVTELASP